MSAVMIACRLLLADASVTNNVFHSVARQPVEAPFIVVTSIFEGQTQFINTAAEAYETRVSVEIITENHIDCDRQAEAVKACLGNVRHVDVANGSDPGWSDVCSLKSGGDIMDYNDDEAVFRRVIDFTIRWKPAT